MVIFLAIFTVGFTAMASQIVLMRELLTVFCGNEFSIGIILAAWLLGGGSGSFVSGKFSGRIKSGSSVIIYFQMLLVSALPLFLLVTRLARNFLNASPGQLMPFSHMVLSSFAVMFPLSAALGALFTVGCKIVNTGEGAGHLGIGRIFMAEAVGSLIGGLTASFFCMRFLGSFEIFGFVGLVNLLSAFILQTFFDREYKLRKIRWALLAVTAIFSISLFIAGLWGRLDERLLAGQWRDYRLLASKSSVYGTIALLKRGEQISFFDNGLHIYTMPDKMYAEESVHYALLEHPKPSSVLLIGGGVGGLVEEILKHPVDSVDYIELDPLIVDMARAYLPRRLFSAIEDPRVSVKNIDGRFFLKNTDKKYDCIILNIGDPYTAGLNRFYTLEFLREVKRALRDGGIFSCVLTSSESYINKELGDYLRSVHSTMSEVFHDVKMIPGDRVVFLGSAGPGKDLLTYDDKLLEERSLSRGLGLEFVRGYYMFSKLSKPRIDYIENTMKAPGSVRLNLDFWPSSYHYATIFWASHFRDSLLTKILSRIKDTTVWMFIAVLFIMAVIYAFFGRRVTGPKPYRGLGLAVAAAGFTGMALQVIIVIAFQMIYGYLFYKLGIILTAFM
nr:hypothetical protein [Candidatus Omnitrophota bacterium]